MAQNHCLEDQVAIVTGASRGIGAAIAKRLARDGAAVVVNYTLSEEKAAQVVKEIRASGGRAVAVQGDVADPATGAKLAEAAQREFGRVDILVNNAAIFRADDGAAELFDVNVVGLLNVTQAVVPHIRAGGSIINVSSGAGRDPLPSAVAYSATKAAVDSITKAQSRSLGPKGIRVNAIAPGVTATDMSAGVAGEGFYEVAAQASPIGIIGDVDDIAEGASYLAGPGAKFVTGSILAIDGGVRF